MIEQAAAYADNWLAQTPVDAGIIPAYRTMRRTIGDLGMNEDFGHQGEAKAFDLGVRGYLAKPVRPTARAARVRAVLWRAKA
jgi:PleD family two-component response regulator